jgi:formamidopyrimidine-DNA glycosylase
MRRVPELPDIEDYRAALRQRVVGDVLERLRITSFSLLKTYDPPVSAVEGEVVTDVRRLGKRLVLEFADTGEDEPLFLVLHLMIAGRLRWREHGAKVPGRIGLAAFDFPAGTAILTEAGTKKRASLHVVRGEQALAEGHDRGGVEPLEVDAATFAEALTRENRTLKRALTDPRLFSGIGNAFSDEILHAAGLSPVQLTSRLDDEEVARLHAATVRTLRAWVDRLREQTGEGFPEDVTAFRPDFAVHGRYEQPCPVCGSPVQRIRYADNETNYCPRCQTDGRLLADRSLSRLLKDDWPRTVDELE